MTAADGVTFVRQILDTSRYLVLGTADENGTPWTSPVWFAHADYRELLWISDPGARHSRNIAANPQVSIVVFDSTVAPSEGGAVYISGIAAMVMGPGLEHAIATYSRRSRQQHLRQWNLGDVQAPSRHRLYRARGFEFSVLRPGGGDIRNPVSTESLTTMSRPNWDAP